MIESSSSPKLGLRPLYIRDQEGIHSQDQGLRPIHTSSIKDWSLITGRGEGGYKTGCGASDVLPLQKRGDGTSFSHAEGGGGGHNMF